MAPPKANERTVQYRRTHNLLLGTRLLSQRGTPSPFTLLLDSLSQSSIPLVEEYIARAKLARVNVVYISFATLRPPKNVSKVIRARGRPLDGLQKEILVATLATAEQQTEPGKGSQNMLVIDSLNHLISISNEGGGGAVGGTGGAVGTGGSGNSPGLASFLSSLLTPSTTLLATYHTDIPRVLQNPGAVNPYAPDPIELLKYLCTTLITVYSPAHVFAEKRAQDRSLPLPSFGMDEGIEGAAVSLGTNTGWCDSCPPRERSQALIYELEHRRMSGRAMSEWFFLMCHPSKKTKEKLILLEDHPAYNPTIITPTAKENPQDALDDSDLTFSLSLTAKQKGDRDRVVLPYFDAQSEEGGTGGRILYVPGREDDWDDEEDEI
ncbi:hypothetical protein DRE_02360 [Drechslerella stenobrocha 248]|uniref:Elongator complex protein 5 n=1 Tax=Drechslerella stenobrocha 248 TaxID=1043628 RepID=W7HVN8_9PEZI|nr:hypothetical protein DRE_02360 [Drechslerella stenobrocha 248]